MFSDDKDKQTLPGKYRLFVWIFFFIPLNGMLIMYIANLIGYESFLGVKTEYFALNPNQYGIPHPIAITLGCIVVFNSLFFYLTIRSSATLVFLIDSAIYCFYAFIMWAVKGPNIFYLGPLVTLPIISLIILYYRNNKRFEKNENKDGDKSQEEDDEVNDEEVVPEKE